MAIPHFVNVSSRREFLSRAGAGFGAIAFNYLLAQDRLLAADAAGVAPAPHHAARAKSIIWLFMEGGPSHLDLFDPKPTLDKLAGQSKDTGGAALLNLLGKRVSFDGSTLVVQAGKTPTVRYTVPEAADKVTATVRASDGTAVRVVELGAQSAGQHTFAFDGKGALGTVLPDGSYRLEIAASTRDAKTPTALRLLTEATVDGVDLSAL